MPDLEQELDDRGREVHVLGPPGTGKTTYLSARIRSTVQARGSEAVAVASFTTAAAAELGGRNLPLDRRSIGTLHSHAYRAIDTPPVAAERLTEWNKAHPALAVSASTGKGSGPSPLDEPAEEWTGATDGDALMGELERLRNRMVPPELWPPNVRALSAKWEDWKRAEGVVDFTDMVEHARRDTVRMPTAPRVGFFDETQDNTDLELALIRHWGQDMDRVVLAYDDDQRLYDFRGSTAEGLLDHPVPDGDRYVLGQSWRVPASVHRAAEKWIRRVSRREEKLYLPRTVEGTVRQTRANYSDPKALLAQVELALTDRAEVPDGNGGTRPGTVMVLASCGYMLDPLKHEMRAAGVPFHNPYRRRRGDWNPLGGGRGVSSASRLLAYLVMDERMFGEAARLWTGGDVQRWSHVLRTQGVFRRGAKTAIAGFPDRELTYAEVSQLFADDAALEQATAPDLGWFEEHLLAAAVPGMRFPLAVAGRYGGAALQAEPRVVLGTIHCSPPDELVLTTTGPKPIADLQPGVDRLVGYHRGTNRLLGRGGHANSQGYDWRRSERPYDGDLVVLDTGTSRTRVTPNHRVLARLDDDAFCGRWVVYLMRRGNWWRVGVCTSAHRPYRSGGVAGRLATEQADDGWILSVHDDRRSALMAEAVVQGRYGMPGLTFQSAVARSLSDPDLAAVHDRTAAEVGVRVKLLLEEFGLSEDWPLYRRRAHGRTNLRGWFCTEAANLVALSGRVCMATDAGGRSPEARAAVVTTESYRGSVFGLDVPPHHWYVSGNAVVHNSVKGGQADAVFLIPDLSARGYGEWSKAGAPRDSVIRQFYVGMTRAREELVVCDPSTEAYVPPVRLVQGARERVSP